MAKEHSFDISAKIDMQNFKNALNMVDREVSNRYDFKGTTYEVNFKEKEKNLENFKNNGNILLTTTVIEVGISLPKLSTIIIVGAERMGLATLHQLRGRVGRYGQKGYCFLYTHDKNNKRLKAFANTLDGFKIAELDLKFRKSGDLLDGTTQSGESFKYFDEVNDLEILEDVKRYIETI